MSPQSNSSWADREQAAQSEAGGPGPAGWFGPSGWFGPYGPQRTRGFTPLFRNVYSDQHLRVSDAERQQVVDQLAQHFAEGRLDQAEFDERSSRAMNAKTRADLGGLFDDLPEAGAPAVPELPRRRRRHPILTLALIVVIALAAAHVLAWAAWGVPWLWLGFIAVALLFATGHLGHHHPRQDR
jgi:Domain of unknown function (DUF1707)